MINDAHVIVYSKDAEADKAFIKTILKFKYMDVHKGWLIFQASSIGSGGSSVG
jgi:hypothetical protein